MNVMIYLGVIILAAVAAATLQLNLGALLSLYHASASRHISKKSRDLADSFIAGVGTITLLGFATFVFVLERIFAGDFNNQFILVIAIILFILALFALLFYYHRGDNTELWLPRKVAKFINERAKTTEETVEAFSLGMLAGISEWPFTAALMVVAGHSMLQLSPDFQLLMWAVFTIIAILPLIIFRFVIKRGKTVVDIQRWRINQKTFFRILTCLCYIALGLFLIAFEVM